MNFVMFFDFIKNTRIFKYLNFLQRQLKLTQS